MYSPFRAFIFISTLLFSILAGPAKRELCQLITSESPNSSPAQLFMNTLPVKQSSCVKFFSLDLENSMFEGKYVTIEVNFHDLPNVLALQPKLLYKINSKPFMYFNYQSHSTNHVNIEEDAHGTDSNAFFNRKAYHHIVLTPEVIENGGVSYFAVYKASSAEAEYFNGTISYDINIKTSDTFPCPQHCSGNGKCNQKHKRCVCNKGFFDLDCSVQAAPLIPQKITTESVEGFKWGYFYYQTDSGLEDIKLNVAKSGGRVRFSLLVRDAQDSSLPNFHDSEGSSTLTPKENDIELAITRPLLSGDNNDRQVVIGVYNFDDQPVAVGIEIELSDSKGMAKTIILFSVAGILVGLAAFLATLLFIKYRYPRIWTRAEQDQNTRSQITKEEVEKYFPQHQFNHFKSSFPQTLCSICLEDFTKDSSCRQLYCEHVFHGDCIDAWIIQHENCPNCKKEMTKEAIKAQFSKAKPNKNSKAKQTNGENNHHITVQIPTPKTHQTANEQDRLLNMSNMSHTTTS